MSFTIVDNTGDWSAKYVYEKPPDFHLANKPEVEIQKYYEKQHQIWAEGYYRNGEKVLSGKHYFYMQECWLKTGRGDFIRPYWKDSDDLVFSTIDDCLKDPNNVEDLFILKRREIGLTSMIAAGLSFWYARMFPGATLNLTSADKKRFVRMYNDKIHVTYSRMSPYIMNCTPKNINHSKNDVYLKVSMKKKLPDGTYEDRDTEFNLIETSQTDESVSNFSASRTPFMFVDEIFLHPRAIKLIRAAKATMMDGTDKFGFFIGGGTCEESVSQEELTEYHKLWVEAKERGIRTVFLPAWLGLTQCSVNGWSDEKKGTEWVEKKIEAAKKSSDPNELLSVRKQYPLTEDDVWDLADGDGAFEKDVMDILAHTQKTLTETKSSPEGQYKLLPSPNGIVAIPDERARDKHTGGFWITEMPEMGQGYYQTVDGAASGKLDGAEEGSWIASITWKAESSKGDHYCPVCIYYERPDKLEDGYRNMVNQFNFYNKHDGMQHINYETNAGVGGNFGTYLDNNNLLKFIMRRKDLTEKGWINTNKLGTAVDPHILLALRRRANPFLRKFAQFFRSQMVLSALRAPAGENSDIRSAFLIFMASIADWDKPKKKNVKQRYRTNVELVRNHRGELVLKSTQIPIQNDHLPTHAQSELQTYQDYLVKKYGDAYWYNKSTAEERMRYRELKGTDIPT